MKTDIEIAQEAKLQPITEVAKKLELNADDLELYGKYKAKISNEYLNSIKDKKDGKKGKDNKEKGKEKKEIYASCENRGSGMKHI